MRKELSQPAIIEGVKNGHVYVKVKGPDGPDLFLTCGKSMMGDAVAASSARPLNFGLRVVNGVGTQLLLLVDGMPLPSRGIWKVSNHDESFSESVDMDRSRHWIRAILNSPSGELIALTNPIYVNDRPEAIGSVK